MFLEGGVPHAVFIGRLSGTHKFDAQILFRQLQARGAQSFSHHAPLHDSASGCQKYSCQLDIVGAWRSAVTAIGYSRKAQNL